MTLQNTKRETPTKASVESLSEDDRIRRDVSTVFNDQDNELDNFNLTKVDWITVKSVRLINEEVLKKNCFYDELIKSTISRFNPTLQNYLKVSVGNTVSNLTKYDRKQKINTTLIKIGNAGTKLLLSWRIEFNDKNNAGKLIFL